MRKKINILLLLFITLRIGAQQSDSLFEAFEKEFEDFNTDIESEIDQFESQNDSIFLKFLEETWREYELFLDEQPARPKPVEQPELEAKRDTVQHELEINTTIKTEPDTSGEINISDQTPLKSKAAREDFTIYGIQSHILYYPDNLPHLSTVNKESIISFYKRLSKDGSAWNYNLKALGQLKNKYRLNDWGYYKILLQAAERVYHRKNEQQLLVWYLLVNSNYLVKIGYDDSNIYILLPSNNELFNIQFMEEGALKYYIFHDADKQPKKIHTYPGFPNENARIFSFSLINVPVFPLSSTYTKSINFKNQVLELHFNPELIEFFNSYPQCSLNNYFALPISSQNIQELESLFNPMFHGKTNREKIDILLDFCQNSLEYKIDQQQFGKERFMFAEECLYYPFSDCEDRSALLGELVKHFTGLSAIGLEFKEHVTLAVHIPGENDGTYVTYKGTKYFVCDSTYINATVGMLPDNMIDEKPKIILF